MKFNFVILAKAGLFQHTVHPCGDY